MATRALAPSSTSEATKEPAAAASRERPARTWCAHTGLNIAASVSHHVGIRDHLKVRYCERHTICIIVYFMESQPSPSSYFQAAARSRRTATSQLVSIRLPEDLIRRLAEVGNEQGLSMSDTIRLVLERGLARPKERSRSK